MCKVTSNRKMTPRCKSESRIVKVGFKKLNDVLNLKKPEHKNRFTNIVPLDHHVLQQAFVVCGCVKCSV